MSFERAMQILFDRGWNYDGAYAIADQLVKDCMLDGITEEQLIAISDDYADR